jgi:membrane fusion protein, multidrug efflux system
MIRWFSDILAVLIVAGVAAWVGIQYGHQNAGKSTEQAAPVGVGAPVKVEVVRKGSIGTEIVAFGQVTPIPGETHVYSVPLESKVDSISVTPGQRIGKGDVLMRVSPSPDAALALEQAREDAAYAIRVLELAQQRMSMKLATESEVEMARNAQSRAQAMLDSLLARGVTGPTDIAADEDGVVTESLWSPGSIVPAGTPLVRVVPIGQLQAVLWVEAEDVGPLSMGKKVAIAPVERGQHPQAHGLIRSIAHSVDPTTRLVEVTVSLVDDGLLLGQFIRGTIRADSTHGLLIPRAALLATPEGEAVFTIENGTTARSIVVTVLAESGDEAIIEGDGIAEGAVVVVQGAAGLSDGTKVEVEK